MSAGEHAGERLSAYLDDELDERERAAVDGHLRECAACRELLEDLALVDSAARGLPVSAPAGYFDTLPARVRERIAARRRRKVPAWTWAAAAAVLLAMLTPLTLRERSAPARQADRAYATAPQPAQAPPAPAAAPTAPASSTRPGLSEPRATREAGEAEQHRLVRQGGVAVDGRLQQRDAAAPGPASAELKKEAPATKVLADQAPAKPADALEERGERADEQREARFTPASASPAPAPAAPASEPAARRKTAAANAAEGRAQVAGAPGGVLGGADAQGRTLTLDGESLGEEDFDALAARPQRTAAEARAAARSFEAYARRHAESPQADEARARAVESLAAAWRLEKSPADRERARALGRAYLQGDGRLKDRVRAALALLGG